MACKTVDLTVRSPEAATARTVMVVAVVATKVDGAATVVVQVATTAMETAVIDTGAWAHIQI